jgi:hypothetical protein
VYGFVPEALKNIVPTVGLPADGFELFPTVTVPPLVLLPGAVPNPN